MAWVLFFDGDCGFCNKSIQRVHRIDTHQRVDFAPLQGELSRSLGLEKYASLNGTIVLLDEESGAKFFKFEAVSQLGKILGGVYRLLGFLLRLFPLFLTNRLYDLIARHRYLLVGKTAGSCGFPDENFRKRMRH
ncbi:thiol-disulfide oxidoreductase DCC family protein [Luteolibacter algae]|uniref:Thiol-disulfide oxidoreductase DCC family protein n=1 Tax=Luteolibacter algae TaxID=454151 RepID=A0ABW5D7X0_9BACT